MARSNSATANQIKVDAFSSKCSAWRWRSISGFHFQFAAQCAAGLLGSNPILNAYGQRNITVDIITDFCIIPT
jgi:hypothetical protein